MEDLIVGRLRNLRDRLIRECAITSSIDAIIYLMGQPQKDFQIVRDGIEPSEDLIKNYAVGLAQANIIPYGVEIKEADVAKISADLFQYLYTVRSELSGDLPLALTGAPVGASGRLQDITYNTAMRRFEQIVKNTGYAFGTAFGMGLEMCDRIPGLYPPELKKGDINGFFEVEIELKAEDPIEADRKATLGSRLLANSEIDPETNLIEYKGYSQEDARQILIDTLKWKVLLNSPDIAQLIGLRAAEKSGMAEELQIIQARRQGIEKQQQALVERPTQSAMTRQTGEVKTPIGREMADAFMGGYGARRPPEPYTRGGQ